MSPKIPERMIKRGSGIFLIFQRIKKLAKQMIPVGQSVAGRRPKTTTAPAMAPVTFARPLWGHYQWMSGR